MEKSFDLGRLLKNHEKKHKSKPVQFGSVAGGVQKRLENNIKCRKSNRLTAFDNLRNLTTCENTRDISEVSDKKSKVEHRRLQLEKWKEEKEKRKKEATAQKKKPFVTGVVHAPLKFVPPPPLSKPMPSTSGRVTRSQVSKNVTKPKPKYSKITQSFAPNNATFKAPQLKNVIVLPTMTQALKKKEKIVYEFKPVLPNTSKENIKQTRAKTSNNKKIVEASITWHKKKTIQNKSKANINKQTPKKKMLSNILESSSSSEIFSSKSSESCNEVDMGTSTKFETLKRQSILLQSSSSSEVEGSSIEKSPILKSRTPRQSLPKNTKAFTPKNPVPKSESSSEEKLRSPKSPIDVSMTPEQIDEAKKISPCVTMSRGKDNARKEMKKKMEEGLLDEDTSDIDSVNHFRRQLDSEIKRMTEMCEVWEKIRDQTTLSESIQELVLSAVGQARLLMSQKLRQFSSLVDRCANPSPAHALVTPADLAGFWDMVFMQVENIDMRFKKLEELRKRNWVEIVPVEAKKKVVPKINTKKVVKPIGGPSRLRDMIAAARKAKMDSDSSPTSDASTADNAESKTFEAGFFCVRSPIRSPRSTPSKPTLLKAVLSSEAKKSASKSSSFAMLRASVLCKNIEHDGIAPLPQTPINLNATPARSILKSATASDKKAAKKSIKVVLFDDSDNNIQENSDSTEEPFNGFENPPECHNDSGMSSMDVKNEVDVKENKENERGNRKKNRLVRQDATTEDETMVMTRSRRKSINTPKDVPEDHVAQDKTPRRSSRKKNVLQEADSNLVTAKHETPKRMVRSRRSTGLHSVKT